MSSVNLKTEELDLLKAAFWAAADYVPSWAQEEAHSDGSRVKLSVGGVRAGKSKWAAMEASKYVFIPDALIWIVGPDYDQAEAEFWYLHKPLKDLGLIDDEFTPDKGAKKFTTQWGATVETVSIKQGVEHIASFAVDLFLIVEAGQQPWEVVEKAYERTLEKGSPILISGTLEKNKYPWLSQKHREWKGDNESGAKSFSLPSWSNLTIFPLGRQDPKILDYERAMSKAKFLERCAAVPLKPEGLVYPEFDYPIHVDEKMEMHPNAPVGLAIDPGYGGAYSVVFVQKIGVFYNVLSEVYMRRTKARNVIAAVKEHPLIEHVTYAVLDVAAKQHYADDSQWEIWENEFPTWDLYANKVGILDGIEVLASRLKVDEVLERPLIMFSPDFSSDVDIDGQALGLFSEFDLYVWSNKVGGNEKTLPVDANNHALKALTYFIYHHDGVSVLTDRNTTSVKRRGYWL